MIQANELRIGNLVKIVITNSNIKHEEQVISVYRLSKGMVDGFIERNIEPIPLTEEWLLKTEANHENGRFYFDHFTIRKNEFTSEWEVFFSDDGNQIAIKFLHELQNLFFAFHKKELELT